jgi:outer membrane protein assembly factor BamD (BamD/ComL family)
MALYHAGMAEFRTGKRDLARKNLDEFLKEYTQNDGWTASAKETLKQLAGAAK